MSLLVLLLKVNLTQSSFFEVHIQWSHHSHMSYLISNKACTIKEVMIDKLVISTIFLTTIAIPLMG